jgi:hypothetical protein
VSDEQVLGAAARLFMLSPVAENTDKYELQNKVLLSRKTKGKK